MGANGEPDAFRDRPLAARVLLGVTSELLGEERVALGAGVDLGGESGHAELIDEEGRGMLVQPADLDPMPQPRPNELCDALRDRRREVLGPHGDDQQDTRARPRNREQQLERRPVGPLQIVDADDDRPLRVGEEM
jgi:hypothetical protein